MLELTQEEINQAVHRAAEIAEKQAVGGQTSGHVYEPYIAAAEEVGIPRDAMVQALEERQAALHEQRAALHTRYRVGDMVLAPSADKSAYPASIVQVSDNDAVVQFAAGGERTVPLAALEPLELVPGRTVQFQDENAMGTGIWISGKVHEYHPGTRTATISYACDTYAIPLTKIRVRQIVQKQTVQSNGIRTLLFRTAVVAAAGGGIIGFLAGWLMHGR